MTLLNLDHIKQASSRIQKFVNDTPVLTSSLLNKWLGHDIYFKAEGFQKIGAFKARGACNTITWLTENGNTPQHIVANSSGNHAQAVAWAAALHGISSTIFMPSFSSQVKIQATKAYGAEVVLTDTRVQTNQLVKEAAQKEGTYWVHPYNHEQVLLGQGTAAYDAIQKIGEVDAAFAPCGGGGLLSGTYIATRGLCPQAKIIGAEPLQANDAAISLRQNSIYQLNKNPDTLADGARTLAVGDITFEYLKKLDDFHEISEADMIYWTQWLSHLLKIRIEPTSALAMAAAHQWVSTQYTKKKVLIVLSGGNIDQPTNLKIWKDDYLSTIPQPISLV